MCESNEVEGAAKLLQHRKDISVSPKEFYDLISSYEFMSTLPEFTEKLLRDFSMSENAAGKLP